LVGWHTGAVSSPPDILKYKRFWKHFEEKQNLRADLEEIFRKRPEDIYNRSKLMGFNL
jgi:hypothetical protein